MNEPVSGINELKKNEGKSVQVKGMLLPSDVMKRIPVRIQLNDSALVYLGTFDPASGLEFDKLETYYNKNILIKGIVYFNHIPSGYEIVSRLNGPYLVDIKDIQFSEELDH